jgi:hypothetical protein
MRNSQGRFVDRPARRVRDHHPQRDRHHSEERHQQRARNPPERARGAATPSARARRAPRGDCGRSGGSEQQQTTDDEPQPAYVSPIRPQEDGVQTVRDNPEADRDQTNRQTQRHPRRPNQPRLREDPTHWDGHNHSHAEQRRVRPRQRKIAQVHRDEREPRHQQRPLQASEAARPRTRRPRCGSWGGHRLGTLTGGGHPAPILCEARPAR